MFLEVFSNLNDSMIILTRSHREVIGRKGTRKMKVFLIGVGCLKQRQINSDLLDVARAG